MKGAITVKTFRIFLDAISLAIDVAIFVLLLRLRRRTADESAE